MPKPKKQLPLLTVLSVLSLTLTACANTKLATPTIATTASSPPTAPTPSICVKWSPITYSASQDSEETARQVVAANALMATYCNPQPIAASAAH